MAGGTWWRIIYFQWYIKVLLKIPVDCCMTGQGKAYVHRTFILRDAGMSIYRVLCLKIPLAGTSSMTSAPILLLRICWSIANHTGIMTEWI